MVGPRHIRMDGGILHPGSQRIGNAEIVNAPSDIPGAGARAVGPPAVPARLLRMQGAERIRKTGLKQQREPGALLDRKSVV